MQIIAHRGDCSTCIENTMPAFEAVLSSNVEFVELDIQQVEEDFYVYHDFSLDRLTNQTGRLENKLKQDITQIMVNGLYPIPTLNEVAALIKDKVTINVEIKSVKNVGLFSENILKLISKFQCKFIISSFLHGTLLLCKQQLKALDHNVQFAALIAHAPIDHASYAISLGVDIAAIDCEVVSREFVKHAHEHGLKVWCYTVNSYERLQTLNGFGVDAIFTDDPTWALKQLPNLR